jgi:hypothetical protein
MEPTISKQETGDLVRAQHRFEDALRAAGCKQESIEYAVNCVDPFHDLNMTVAGYPDGVGGKSVVQAITKQFTIKVPTNPGIAAAPWDVHFVNNPSLCGINAHDGPWWEVADGMLYPVAQIQTGGGLAQGHQTVIPLGANQAYINYDTPSTVRPAGLLEWCAVPSGRNTFDPRVDGFYGSMNVNDILADPEARSRIIGFGFEVHNTTAELYKSGGVTVYRADSDPSEQQLKFGAGVFHVTEVTLASGAVNISGPNAPEFTDINTGNLLIRERSAPPISVAQATQMRSATWTACEGCLVPSTMDVTGDLTPRKPASGCSYQHITEAPFSTLTTIPTGLGTNSSAVGTDVNASARLGWMSTPKATSIVLADGPPRVVQSHGQGGDYLETTFNRSGAYFTGLDEHTTLTLVVKVFIEQFPNPGSNLLPLASLTAPYDPHIFSALAGIYRDTAPGYPVHMNDTGDFFKEMAGAALDVAEDTILPILQAIPHPAAQGIAFGGKVIQRMRKGGKVSNNNNKQAYVPPARNNNFSTPLPKYKPERAKTRKITVRNKRGNGRRSK